MRLWLRSATEAVGLDCDVIPREALAELLDLDAAAVAVKARCERCVAEAQERAQALIEDAQKQADSLLGAAQDKFDRSARLGYAAGIRRQLDDWNMKGARHAFAATAAAYRARERLAELVARACEQVVHVQDPAALYACAAQALVSALDQATVLRVSVHPDAVADARRAFDQETAEIGWTCSIDVCADAELAPGRCVCEWDTGVFEADLRDELRSLRRVIRRVLTAEATQDVA
ncbi:MULTISPECIES: type III secretion system stator protein SctL [Xanthomonas]|uniref:Type 3 secretion system stator protein n=1 Tax=Xanthomonas cucurbitae TaxID=56453 RepID=A0A2S7DF67_9XANT|nr:type III secretion system stator protein SctL [Xanthomonas cucurbitae]PPU72456.1 ATP-dependent helicase HrpB [Xanthomonas cucurbitae]QHG88373.1 HrpE/YscL family type III secretion apparatus protein [Xanthomonas cucurbitae]WDM67229.1 type III secretion system stator protein SctL [Xanthomonas cucurbitae]WDM71107.1 type III secretion system stator protein SctL [Xanthomonas cucurbitae]WDM74940.1 type III secretion system stator protein SctL [Xanthomonas cucurbitae]